MECQLGGQAPPEERGDALGLVNEPDAESLDGASALLVLRGS